MGARKPPSAKPAPTEKMAGESRPLARRIADLEERLASAFGRRRSATSPYTALLERLPDPLMVWCAGRIVYLNPPAAALFGAPAQVDAEQRRQAAFADSRIKGGLRQFVKSAISAGAKASPVLHVVAGKWGQAVEVETRCADIDWNGEPAILISAHHVGAAAPERSKPADPPRAGDGIWDWDLEKGEVYMSRRLRALLGYAEHELPPTEDTWIGLIHPDDRAENDRRLREHFEGLTTVYDSRVRARRHSGDFVAVRLRGKAARRTDGKVRRISGTLQLEARSFVPHLPGFSGVVDTGGAAAGVLHGMITAALDEAGVALAIFDPDDRLILMNGVYRRDLPGLADPPPPDTSFEDILRIQLDTGAILSAEGDQEGWLHRRLARHGTGRIVETHSFADGRTMEITEITAADGSTVILRTDVTRAAQAEEDLQARIRELEDFQRKLEEQSTELQGAIRELAEARDEADAANHTKSEFLANMSHELRTPLNAIMGFSEVIKDEMFGPVGLSQYVDYARDIYESGAHLLEIINDILDLSKVEAGKLDLSEETLPVGEVIGSVLQIVKSRAEAGAIRLRADIPPGLPMIHADSRKLKQMLLNLLSNAIKFTHQDGTVELVARENEAGEIQIIVRDDGIGIDPDKQELVLTPFGQVDSALAREHQGTGLGLPLVKALVELHGGHLQIDSTPGKGTTVALTFPAERTLKAGAGVIR